METNTEVTQTQTDVNSGNDVTPETEVDTQTQEAATSEGGDTSNTDDGKVTSESEGDDTKEGGEEAPKDDYRLDDLKLPEGLQVTDEQREVFKTDAEALGFTTKDQAQKFLDWVLKKASEADGELVKQQENNMGNLEKSWQEEGKKDPVLGKDYDKNVSDAMATAEQIFSPRTLEFLKDTRFSSNPDFLKDMLRISKERADAELIGGTNSKPTGPKRDSYGNPMLTFNS